MAQESTWEKREKRDETNPHSDKYLPIAANMWKQRCRFPSVPKHGNDSFLASSQLRLSVCALGLNAMRDHSALNVSVLVLMQAPALQGYRHF